MVLCLRRDGFSFSCGTSVLYRSDVFISSCVTTWIGSAAGTADGDRPPLRDSGVPTLEGLSAAISAFILGGTADGLIGVPWLEVIDGGGPRFTALAAFAALTLAAQPPDFVSDVGVLPSISMEDGSGVDGMSGGNGALSPMFDNLCEGTGAKELESNSTCPGRLVARGRDNTSLREVMLRRSVGGRL
jgi:hypothetical protein